MSGEVAAYTIGQPSEADHNNDRDQVLLPLWVIMQAARRPPSTSLKHLCLVFLDLGEDLDIADQASSRILTRSASKKNQRIHRLERPVLPLADGLEPRP
jgi:hypothetical protein